MREFLVNADFDISLRPGRGPQASDGRGRQAREIPYHLLLLGTGGDSVLVGAEPGEDFLAYLENAGLPRPFSCVLPSVTRDARLAPFGWNKEAEEFNRSYASPAVHPPTEVVKRVNGRRFAAALEREMLGVDEVLGVFETEAEIEACVASRPADEEWLLKSEHGNAGLGNRRLRSRPISRSDREVIRRLLGEDHCVLLERWRRRVLDISTVFDIGLDGAVGAVHIYEVINTADGAYLGSIFEPDSAVVEPWCRAATDVAVVVGRRLFEEGYFGPVCLDHFVWSDGGSQRLRPLADLNARLQISSPILRLWGSWRRDRVVYWRLFAARKLRLPSDYGELGAALDGDAFDASSRLGVLITSPFEVGGRQLRRVGVMLSATSRDEVEELDRRLRGRFER